MSDLKKFLLNCIGINSTEKSFSMTLVRESMKILNKTENKEFKDP